MKPLNDMALSIYANCGVHGVNKEDRRGLAEFTMNEIKSTIETGRKLYRELRMTESFELGVPMAETSLPRQTDEMSDGEIWLFCRWVHSMAQCLIGAKSEFAEAKKRMKNLTCQAVEGGLLSQTPADGGTFILHLLFGIAKPKEKDESRSTGLPTGDGPNSNDSAAKAVLPPFDGDVAGQ